MGSAASTKLQCPKDYNENDFKMILKLFDKLDNNGDRVVETNELKEISELHVKNRIRLLKEKIVSITNNAELEIERIELNRIQKIKQVNEAFYNKKRTIESELHFTGVNLQNKINEYEIMDEKEKSEKVFNAISKDNHIEFWKFFEYMRNKTDDIKNIEF